MAARVGGEERDRSGKKGRYTSMRGEEKVRNVSGFNQE